MPVEGNLETRKDPNLFSWISKSSVMSEMCDIRHENHESVYVAHFALEIRYVSMAVETAVASFEISVHEYNVFRSRAWPHKAIEFGNPCVV